MSDKTKYTCPGARALVELHEERLRDFIETWKRAKAARTQVTESGSPDYESLETILHHVLQWARTYMTWSCENLGLPDPGIREVPPPERIEGELETHLEHLLDRWRTPLRDVPQERFRSPLYTAPWGMDFCIEAMLEHAVVHPMRHAFQLERWMAK